MTVEKKPLPTELVDVRLADYKKSEDLIGRALPPATATADGEVWFMGQSNVHRQMRHAPTFS
jgi:hypothetical protein